MAVQPQPQNWDLSPTADPTAVLYLRVSSGAQVNKAHDPEGYSIPGQRTACERHAERIGAKVIAEFVEPGRTGTNLERPALQEMLGVLGELRPTYVIFYDLSRVARDDFDALWLWREIDRQGAKIESTRERVDSSPAGRFMYTILAGVNAMRSRDDGEKIKMGLQRKHEDGGTWGPARLGYLNARENVAGREVAVVVPDPDRADLIRWGFELFASGEFTITTLTEILEEAGLTTRPTFKRPSHPLSRSQIHRILRDDFYIGVVTLNGFKRPGRHDAIVGEDTFERVQHLLDAHRASGDRSQKHQHYLSGSLYCSCGRRMGYGRHKNKMGLYYEYFSCLSRVSRTGPCGAAYAPVEAVERAVAAEYQTDRASVSDAERALVCQTVKEFAEAKALTATRESQRHARRLRELTDQQQKLVQLYYRDAISEEVLRAERERIDQERAQARKWAEAASSSVEDVKQAVDEATSLLDRRQIPYTDATLNQRRLINLALFTHIFIIDRDHVNCQPNELYKTLIALARRLSEAQKEAGEGPRAGQDGSPKRNRPVFRGRSSHFDQMAEREGFEPSMDEPPIPVFETVTGGYLTPGIAGFSQIQMWPWGSGWGRSVLSLGDLGRRIGLREQRLRRRGERRRRPVCVDVARVLRFGAARPRGPP